MAIPHLQQRLKSFVWSSMNLLSMLIILKTDYCQLWVLCKSHLRISAAIKHIEIHKINYFSTKKTRCESMNAIFTWRVTWSYANSPFKYLYFVKIILSPSFLFSSSQYISNAVFFITEVGEMILMGNKRISG